MRLSKEELNLLHALQEGWLLKSHRYLDGSKVFRLHWPDGSLPAREIDRAIVDRLYAEDLLDTNMKFPAALFFLSSKGRALL